MTSLLGIMRKTIQDYALIQEGDRVAVGLSGGKDSMALLYLLARFQTFSPFKFHLEAITVDMGFNNFDLSGAKSFCEKLGIPYTVVETEIAKVVFEIRDEKNPCALCANMRRGVLADTMNQRGLNILALGHHADDALTTLFLNMLYAGKLNTLEYKSYLSRTDVHVIRPFLDASEAQVISTVQKEHIPVFKSPCPVDKHTKREEIGDFLKTIYKDLPHSRKNILTAMRNENQCNLFKNKKIPSPKKTSKPTA
ncbi:tRNA 2-thiocytidine biosynthesis protein TtcA [Fusibacter paucivorans]|uniref:tRNA 2-thiocytidine biosynthesis protein TtcA n=1 Tax=Fusibacter paucivorans TaxID=76009 RepID=A0ABS5PKJ8_9FIRM|nr:tRNA 2-thiocytidine biosynthesis TtcA family protein [Fusibacter paucivorans]MBS7525695.1 tRNA 2-thiocytidine biosynthesis protein TtcA [Fusibacter paucivorans]